MLQVALLLGGLFVLGMFCGERAHAAESAGALGDAAATREVQSPVTGLGTSEQTPGPVHRVVRPAVEPAAEPAVTATAKPTEQPTAQPSVKPTANPAVRPTAQPTAKPVDEVVGRAAEEQAGERVDESAVRPVRQLVDRAVGALSDVAPSADPDWQDLSELPGLPGFPGAPSLPGGILPGGDGVQPPQGTTGDQPGGEAMVEDGARTSPDAEYGSAYGPCTQIALADRDLMDRHHGGAVRPVHVPARTPGGVPTGAIVNQSLVDTTSLRHGDLHAASFAEGAPFRLMLCGTAATDDAGVRDRHRDINEFPG
ncbi:hypothetical protein STSP_34490 [Streptomyces jeddahensis]|uniref:Uncharacterized protein n=1 Tax=Streptomyces jeddahensis TaxID=1716141 RepID=A0A177HSH2_9ACTN|nr:hypothetical protein STSP_34490 [Streptomyces jeddahensis]